MLTKSWADASMSKVDSGTRASRLVMTSTLVWCCRHSCSVCRSGLPLIAGYPTIKLFHVNGGKLVSSDYSGGRSAADIVKGALAEAAKVALGRIGAKAGGGGGGGRASGGRKRQHVVFCVMVVAVMPVPPNSSSSSSNTVACFTHHQHPWSTSCTRGRGPGWVRGWRRRRRGGSVWCSDRHRQADGCRFPRAGACCFRLLSSFDTTTDSDELTAGGDICHSLVTTCMCGCTQVRCLCTGDEL